MSLLLVVILGQYSYAESLTNKVQRTTELLKENISNVGKFTTFLYKCVDKITESDFTAMVTCDSAFKKYGIEIGQFFAENKYQIESLIYPTTIPFNAVENSKKNIVDVVGSSDAASISADAQTGSAYSETIGDFSDSCKYKIMAYDLAEFHKCADLIEGFNTHLKNLATETRSEVISITGTDWSGVEEYRSTSSSLSGGIYS
jgi:hypothetical protein